MASSGGGKAKAWVLAEAFVLLSQDLVEDSVTPWSVACESREACMRELHGAVREHVLAHCEGSDDVSGDDIDAAVNQVLESGTVIGDGRAMQWKFLTDDREVVWRLYEQEVA